MLGDYLLENLGALGARLSRHRRGFVRSTTIGLAGFAVMLTLIWFAPTILALFAPKLDLGKDLYTVNRPVAFTFLDASGEVVGHRGAIVGDRLKLDEMPPYLPAAFIAMEDRRFYRNQGIDVRGLVRAFWTNFRAGHIVQGGSTITQQTAKIVFLNPKRTYSRKLEEIFDAAALAKSLSKQQILEVYLNRIYLGAGAYGVDGASRVYFGKSARNDTLAEVAMLATLTSAPSANSPRRNLEAAQTRANIVLNAMVETGAITRKQAEEARAHPAVIGDRGTADARNFFLDTAAEEALKDVSADGDTQASDLVVHTSLVPRLQDAARRAVAKALAARGAKLHVGQAAVVLMEPDGGVAALIGGRNYDASSYNRATEAKRQPGSAFKPFVYLAAIENGASPWDERDDAPVDINGWTPTNYGGRSYGTVTLADALAHSINTVTAGLAQEVGVTTVVDAAHRCGIMSQLQPDASLALGTSEVTPLELTTAYGTFASGGDRIWPYFVTEVEDSSHHVLFQRKAPTEVRVIAAHVDRDMTTMLADVLTKGTGRGAALAGHEAAGKTGTTQDYRDAWFVGFTTDYIAGVWVGNDDSSPMKGVTGGSLPASIWKEVMTAAESGLPPKPLAKSAVRPPTDEEDTTAEAQTGDDELSGGDATTSGENDPGETGQNSTQAPSGASSGGLWDWVFGGRRSTEAPTTTANPTPPDGPSVRRQDPSEPGDLPAEHDLGDHRQQAGRGDSEPSEAAPDVRRRYGQSGQDEPDDAGQPPPPPQGPPPPPPPGVTPPENGNGGN
ncbi:MAG TPA: PBP1A family penicillin-binding protein [Rhizomicrobium sp.]